VPKGRVVAISPRGMAGLLARQAKGLSGQIAWNKKNGGGGMSSTAVVPLHRNGPIPKMSTGSGQTAAQAATALGYTPGGYAPPRQAFAAGMDMMPYLQEDNHGANETVSPQNPSGLPARGVAADSGWALKATYEPHDWSWWVMRFQTQGRAPGPWQQTSAGPSYRALQRPQNPNSYNLYNGVALARPLSQRAYFLPWQTPANVAAQIGGGVNRPLGY